MGKYLLIWIITIFLFPKHIIADYPANGLMGLWQMDELGGTFVADSVGNSLGQASGTAIVGGHKLNGREFDGVSNSISITNLSPFNFSQSQSFSISAWVKSPSGDTSGTYRAIFAKMGADIAGAGYELRLDSTGIGLGRVGLILVGNASTNEYIWAMSTTSVNDGSWHHIVATYNGNGKLSGVSIYIDGQKDQLVSVGDNLNGKSLQNSNPAMIGARNNLDYFKGVLDEIAVYSRELTQAEVTQIAQNPITSPTPTVSPSVEPPNINPIAYWKFEERGTVLVDSSGQGNNANFMGTMIDSGKFSSGRKFNGNNEFATVSNNNFFNYDWYQPFSLTAWVKYFPGDQAGTYRTIFSKEDPGPKFTGIDFRIDNTGFGLGRIALVIVSDTTTGKYFWATGTKSINDGQWHHVVATYNGNGLLSGVALYIDGQKDSLVDIVGQLGIGDSLNQNSIKNTQNARIGTRQNDNYFNGILDELRIYNRVLTLEEVTQIYNYISPPSADFATYFVSPDGNDNYPGTISQPFKTIKKAQEQVRLVNLGMTGNIRINLRQGTYQLDSPLIFDSTDSGKNGFKVVYQNYENEVVLLSGGKKVGGLAPKGHLWVSNIGPNLNFRQLYVNNQRAVKARSTSGLSGAVKTETGYTTTDLSMQNWEDISDIEVVANVYWKQIRCGVQTISGSSITMKQPCFKNAQLHDPTFDLNLPSWLENAFAFLDNPGEWYYSKSSGWLYYYPKNGELISSTEVIVPILENLVIGSSVSNLDFKGLSFAYATWNRPSTNEGFAHMQGDYSLTGIHTSAYDVTPSGNYTQNSANLIFRNSSGIKFENSVFAHLGAIGLSFEDGSQQNEVIGNHFYDISSSAVHLGNVDKPNTTNLSEINMGNLVDNNYIQDVAVEYQGSTAIQATYVQGTTISHNEIFNLPYSGISLGWGWGRTDPTVAKNNLITGNLIHDYALVLNDAGGIYSLSSQPGTVISRNVVKNQVKPFAGIYLDDNSRFITVENNVSFNNARSALFKGGDHTVRDNWWQDRGDAQFVGWPGLNVPDIWWSFGPSFGVNNGCCGANTVTNNRVINSLNEVPATLVVSAGLETTYQSIKDLRIPNYTLLHSLGQYDVLGLRYFLASHNSIFEYGYLVSNFGQ